MKIRCRSFRSCALAWKILILNFMLQIPCAAQPISVEYIPVGRSLAAAVRISPADSVISPFSKLQSFRTDFCQVTIHEIDRGFYTEINGELENLHEGASCGTLRLSFAIRGKEWSWFRGLDGSVPMEAGSAVYDTIPVRTAIPPGGAFNGRNLAGGGYGDPVGRGTMSFYPLCAIGVDDRGYALGVDMFLPVVYRLTARKGEGLAVELDLATSPFTDKFPDRAFFRLCRFEFGPEWGMRAALEQYYRIYPEAFKKRAVREGIWLPFTPLRSIKDWDEFGFGFHETSWGSTDLRAGMKVPNMESDKGTGVLSFQYTEPWDVQIPIKRKNIAYDTLVSPEIIPRVHMEYLGNSATHDKNGLWQARRLETPWFETGWAVSITTNCDPEVTGYSRYRYILDDEITPARKLNVDGIYFDSMEWNWHHDLNYREDHFRCADFPLTFSNRVGRPAIWNFASEFEFMEKLAGEMHAQGKLAMGNGHGWNPFAAANLDLFGAELSWYSSDDHNVEALDFKRAISFRKPIVFLLNEGLNDPAFTKAPFEGYEVYFEKMMAYGFFPSFFSVDASNDPYWQDPVKVENGRPFFRKYIPLIRETAGAGWQPVTLATCGSPSVRIERFGAGERLYFTVRNNGQEDLSCIVSLDLKRLGIEGYYSATELVTGRAAAVNGNKITLQVPAARTRLIRIERQR